MARIVGEMWRVISIVDTAMNDLVPRLQFLFS